MIASLFVRLGISLGIANDRGVRRVVLAKAEELRHELSPQELLEDWRDRALRVGPSLCLLDREARCAGQKLLSVAMAVDRRAFWNDVAAFVP